MTIDNQLHPRLIAAIEAEGITQLNPVQQQVIPFALDGLDLQVSAATGSGKTLAYLLPLMHRLMLDPAAKTAGSRILILVPTRELAQQIHKLSTRLNRFSKLNSVLITGGQQMAYQASMLRRDPDILVATPGRLEEHINRENLSLADVEILVLDEADRMLDMGFKDQVRQLLQKLTGDQQNILLSATLKHRGLREIAGNLLKSPKIIDLAQAQSKHMDIAQRMLLSDEPDHKRQQLLWLLNNQNFEKALVFVNKRTSADSLAAWLRYQKLAVQSLHGELTQDQRKATLQAFRQGKFRVLIATDLAARGLDIDGLNLVINVDMARSGDEYIHRIGRTGRAGQSGEAISLISHLDWNLTAGIQRYLKQKFDLITIPGLKAKYKGPKKTKASGKSVGKKKKTASPPPRTNSRNSTDSKNPGKHQDKTAGSAPPRKKVS